MGIKGDSVLEKAMYAKRPPDAKGAERRKNKADKSSLWANEFNRKLTYRKRSS